METKRRELQLTSLLLPPVPTTTPTLSSEHSQHGNIKNTYLFSLLFYWKPNSSVSLKVKAKILSKTFMALRSPAISSITSPHLSADPPHTCSSHTGLLAISWTYQAHSHPSLHLMFPLQGTLFPQISTKLPTLPSSDLCSNLSFSWCPFWPPYLKSPPHHHTSHFLLYAP